MENYDNNGNKFIKENIKGIESLLNKKKILLKKSCKRKILTKKKMVY